MMNKSGFRRVAVLVGVSLLLLAGMQVAWFVRTYTGMTGEFSRKVSSALEKAAYEELISRTNRIRTAGTITRFSRAGDTDSVRMISWADSMPNIDSLRAIAISYDSLNKIPVSTIQNINMNRLSADSTTVTISINDGGSVNDQRYLTILNMQMRSGFPPRSSLDNCDSLLRQNLLQAEIDLPYRLSVVDKGDAKEIYGLGASSVTNALTLELPTDTEGRSAYRLQIENPNRRFLRSMRGIVLSSLAIIGLVVFSFVYLLRTLFRQKSLERMRLDFTHNITHELKTPISVASAANEALLSFGAYDDPQRRQKYLEVVEGQLDNLSGMVEKILALSLYDDEEHFVLAKEEVVLKPFLEDILDVFSLKGEKKVSAALSVEPEGLALVCDPAHLRHMLDNLLDNALKYSGEHLRVAVSAVGEKGDVVIRVADDGIGMAAPELGRIFDKFYRVSTGDRHEVKGFGLGLYYIRIMAGKHGGTVSVESRPGKGTTFTLRLPQHGR